jgi:hypothetical protein
MSHRQAAMNASGGAACHLAAEGITFLELASIGLGALLHFVSPSSLAPSDRPWH